MSKQIPMFRVTYIDGIYHVSTDYGVYTADYIFIATGDYSFPYHPFSYGLHYSEIQTFTQLKVMLLQSLVVMRCF